MTGDVPEETYHAQQKLQVDVLDLFRMIDQAANGALTGALPRREIQILLRGKCLLAQWIKRMQKMVCLRSAHAKLILSQKVWMLLYWLCLTDHLRVRQG